MVTTKPAFIIIPSGGPLALAKPFNHAQSKSG